MKIRIKKHFDNVEIGNYRDIFTSQGITNCLPDKRFLKAFNNSLMVVEAYNNNILYGFARVVGDGENIIYIEDLIMHKKYEKQGIGTKILEFIENEFKNVRRIVVTTNQDADSKYFFDKRGYKTAVNFMMVSYVKLREEKDK